MADSDNPLPIQPDDNPWLNTPTDATGRPVITVTPRIAQNNNLTDPTTGVDYGNYTDPLIDDVKEAAAKLFGLNGQDRYQLWPERLVRSALSAPADALSGQIQPGSEQEISRAMDMASLAGVGPMAEPATMEMTLGSGMTRMPLMNGGEMANAPVFYSAVENAVKNAKLDNAPVSQWLGYLKNQPGVKQEELDWTLGDLPTDQKMSKIDMQNYVDANKVQLNEVNKGEYDPSKLDERLYYNDLNSNAQHMYNADSYDDLNDTEQQHVRQETFYKQGINPTKFQQYQLPGGSNYKETLLTLPQQTTNFKITGQQLAEKRGVDWNTQSDAHRQVWNEQADQISSQSVGMGGPIYKSSHWDEPNVLAHVRMNDRTVDNGTKTLHLEEIQSDWHQQGRQQGYKLTPQQKTAFDNIDQKIINSGDEDVMGDPDIKSAIAKAVDKKIISADEGKIYLQNYRGADAQNPVPNAPFKQSWPDLVLKRMIRYAADKEYDALSWTPGEAQAARYDLSKHIDDLWYDPVTKRLHAYKGEDHGEESGFGEQKVLDELNVKPEDIEKYVGKDVTKKLLETKPSPFGSHHLSGLDLKIGGEGMKAFYDKMLVDKANAIAKKYGGKVEEKELPNPSKFYTEKIENRYGNHVYDVRSGNPDHPRVHASFDNMKDAQAKADELQKGEPIHFLRLPQSLKDTAQQKGFPLFSGGLMLNPVQQNPFANENVNVDGRQIPINNKQDVMWGAGASNNSNIVNIDKRIPRYDDKLKLPNGQPADLYKYLAIHETAEKPVMERLIAEGKTKEQAYLLAHTQVATPAEKAAVEADGLNWNEYEKIIDGYLKQTEHEKDINSPQDLYLKPYNHNQLRKMKFKPVGYNPFTDS